MDYTLLYIRDQQLKIISRKHRYHWVMVISGQNQILIL